jgi:hypothetical protein
LESSISISLFVGEGRIQANGGDQGFFHGKFHGIPKRVRFCRMDLFSNLSVEPFLFAQKTSKFPRLGGHTSNLFVMNG